MRSPPQGVPEKHSMRIVTLDEPPFIIVSNMDPSTNKCPNKQAVECEWGLSDDSKRLETSNQYKMFDNNGHWNGLVAELVEKRADLCVTALKINSERELDIDFSVPFLETGITITVAYRGGALSPTAFLEPFEYTTWFFILVVSIQLAAVSIFFFEWLSPRSFDCKTTPPPGHKFSLFRSFWLVWATLFSASVNTDIPRSHTARFMALVWAAFSLTFLAVYTANLAAFMITRTEFYDLTGIDDPKTIAVLGYNNNTKFTYIPY
uniref:Ionotropic glutamate receptor C-terminal domain-containing protein n=1 Tax=Romanomermis culicivorax TaxID=13658 RepID=A0A915K5U9_ROMCU